MAKKYTAKKREIEQLSSNLTKCDEVIASLKDDLYQAKKKKDRVVSTNPGPPMPTLLELPTISRIDSSFYPTQEQRPNTASAALEDMSSTDSSTSNPSLTLHIIKSSHAIYLQMKVDPYITTQNLTNKIASRLLLSGSYSDDFESCSLFFRDKELINMSRSISDYQVVNNSALVLMPRRISTSTLLDEKKEQIVQEDVPPSETSNVEKDKSLPLQTSNVNVESKLEEILSAIHALQEVSDCRAKGDNTAQKEKSTTDTQALNIDSTVAAAADDDDSDETRYSSDDDNIQDESHQKDEESSVASGENIKDASDYTNDNDVDKEIKVPLLKVDTTGEVHDNEDSPFNPPTSIEVTSAQDSSPEVDYLPPQKKETKSTSTKEENDASASTCLHYSVSGSNLDNVDDDESNTKSSDETNNSSHDGYDSTEDAVEERTPTPSTGYLDRSIPLLEESTTESEQTWGPEAQQFRFSEFDSSEMKDDDSVDENVNETIDYSNEDEVGIPPNTNLKITSGQPAAVDTSMQSIEISFSEFVPNDEVHTEEKKEDEDHDLNGKKKLFGCFDLFRKKQTKKNMIPKWNRSKRIVKED